MKRLIYLIPLLAAVSCSKGTDGSDAVFTEPFTLSVDKQEIASDGMQVATFVITDANGVVLTDNEELMLKIYFKNEATGRRLAKRTKTFRSVEDGEYTFSATVSGKECANKVTVTSSGRSRYEVFRKNVAVYRFTASWCTYCPSMTLGFQRVSDWTKGRYVELAMHATGSDCAFNELAAQYGTYYYNTKGLPCCLYDLDVTSGDRAYDEIENIIFNRIADAPATCGIQASSSLAEGKLSFSAKIKSSTGGRYDIGFAVLRDNCAPGSGAYEDVYHNVVVGLSGNYEKLSTSSFDLAKNAESAASSNEIDFSLPEGAKIEDFSVVVFALKQNDDDVDIDNIVRFPVGGSVEYAYN